MTMKKMTAFSAIVAGTLLAASQAEAVVAYNFPANLIPNVQSQFAPYLFGNSFVANQAVGISAVGAYDAGLDGFGVGTVPVAIYVSNGAPTPTWTLVPNTSASFTGNSGWDWTDGSARMKNLASPVWLTAGSTYAIVAAYEGIYSSTGPLEDTRAYDFDIPHSGSLPTFNNLSGQISQAPGNRSSFLALPVSTLPGTLGVVQYTGGHNVADYAGATFAAVPEVSQFAMAGIGLLGLVYVGRSTPVRRWLKLA